MAVITINEIDNSAYTQRTVSSDNVVFVPGTAITGPDEPTLCSSYEEFIKTFGSHSTGETSSFGTTWDYAANLLLAGFPVLFQRISGGTYTEEGQQHTISSEKATGDITVSINDCLISFDTEATTVSGVTKVDATFEEKVVRLKPSTFTFTYNNSKWALIVDAGTAVEVTPSDYGIVIPEGTVLQNNDIIKIIVTNKTDPISGDPIKKDITIYDAAAIYGGTFGNGNLIKFVKTTDNVYLCTYESITSTAAMETIKICACGLNDDLTLANIKEAIGVGLDTNYISLVPGDGLDKITGAEFPFGTVYTILGGTDVTDNEIVPLVPSVYKSSSTVFPLSDKFIYNIKFITAGGLYAPTKIVGGAVTYDYTIYENMCQLAEKRGDCVAFPDVPYGIDKTELVNNQSTFFDRDQAMSEINCSYSAAYAPWYYMSISTHPKGKWMAPSFVMLHTLARSISSGYAIWQIPAGVTRASVSNAIKPEYEIGSAILDTWQNSGVQFINPIMKVRQYGYCIWGQKTLYKNLEGALGEKSALQELGVRLIANEIKRRLFDIAVSLTFEPNTIKTWLAFTSAIDPFLSELKIQGALIDYEIKMDESTTTSEDINNNVVNGIVKVNIARAAEDFKISLVLTDSGVTFDTGEY